MFILPELEVFPFLTDENDPFFLSSGDEASLEVIDLADEVFRDVLFVV